MCGIAGIIGEGNNEDRLGQMLEAQKHRGPDSTGEFYDSGVALGHNRLSIIDLSCEANQPFFDAAKRFVLVFNGEIYNYIELKQELKGLYDFTTQSDTEVLLAAYIIWGKNCLEKLNGMFSIAIWDMEKQTLFAARDRFGVKPFHYHISGNSFYFASEIKALHAAGIEKKPDETVWASYFVYGSYGNPGETFWEGISQLPGGHHLEFDNGKIQIEKWYSFETEIKKQPQDLTYEQSKAHYISLLKDSIKLRFRADVAIGFNISGGLDSSVLLAMVNDFTHGSKNINAYTFYTGNHDYDELPWVEMMIEKTRNPLGKVLLEANEIETLARKIQFHEDEPYGGIPTLAYAKLFAQARKDNVTVLLDGQGMDEQWAGYDYYTQSGDATIQGIHNSPYKTNVLSPDFLALAQKPEFPKPFTDDILNKQYRDLFYTKIPRALRFNDRVSMAASTELREPFLDYRLVEFAFSRPLEYKIKDGVTKYMLRDIASEYLSGSLVFAPKRALQTPQREWLGNELEGFVSASIDRIAQSPFAGWFNIPEMKKEWENYKNGDNQSAFHIWQWVSVALNTNG